MSQIGTAPSLLVSALRCRCPACGKGKLFSSYLKLVPHCTDCGQDFRAADTGDGPAFFVSFAALILFAPAFFLIPMIRTGWGWKAFGLGLALAGVVAFCLWGLPRGKALMVGLQMKFKAGEAGRKP
jgi:uncharacterized protein (DUF983 family)